LLADWTSEVIAVPDATGNAAVRQKTVYYVEISVFDGNSIPRAGQSVDNIANLADTSLAELGLTTIVKGSQYTTIVSLFSTGRGSPVHSSAVSQNLNGRSATVDAIRTYTTNTNAMGRVCLTYETADSIAAPTISIWVEGMDIDHLVDVQASGDISKRFKIITASDLTAATNQITGQPMLKNVDTE